MTDQPLTTYEAVLRARASLWGICSTLATRVAGTCWDIAEEAQTRELDLLTDAEEVRHGVLCAIRENEGSA